MLDYSAPADSFIAIGFSLGNATPSGNFTIASAGLIEILDGRPYRITSHSIRDITDLGYCWSTEAYEDPVEVSPAAAWERLLQLIGSEFSGHPLITMNWSRNAYPVLDATDDVGLKWPWDVISADRAIAALSDSEPRFRIPNHDDPLPLSLNDPALVLAYRTAQDWLTLITELRRINRLNTISFEQIFGIIDIEILYAPLHRIVENFQFHRRYRTAG